MKSTRRDPWWLLGVAVILLVARVASGLWAHKHPSKPVNYVQWFSPAEALAQSPKCGKPILYVFSATWCGPCKKMEQEVFADNKMGAYINVNFIPVHVVDDEGEYPEKKILHKQYSIEAFPTLVVVSPEGKVVDSVQGYGGRKVVEKFLADSLKRPVATNPPNKK